MRVVVRILGLAASAALILWCVVIAIRSFTPQAGAGLPRLDGGAGLQALLGVAALITAGLIASGVFALTRPAHRSRHLWPIACLLGWAALTASIASRSEELFLAPEDYELGVGPGTAATVAGSWETWFWVVAAVCAALAVVLIALRPSGAEDASHATPARPPV